MAKKDKSAKKPATKTNKARRSLTAVQVKMVRARLAKGLSIRATAKEVGCAHMTVFRIAHGETYKDA